MHKPYQVVDVFTRTPFMGNPVAVVFEADDLSSAQMQCIARWTNLSETTFICAATEALADYRVRIFTPQRELPFAGHPSIGTAYAALESGLVDAYRDNLVMQCEAGLLPIRIAADGDARRIMVRVPPASHRDADALELGTIAQALSIPAPQPHSNPPQLVNVGPTWLIWDLGEAQTVRRLQPNLAAMALPLEALGTVGITVFGRSLEPDHALAVRSFCPNDGIGEDPVCGSGNACVAAYLHRQQLLDGIGPQYLASQGRELGRNGLVSVCVDASGRIEIGGHAVTCVKSQLRVA